MKCGLLGRKLSHSYSPQIHARLGSYSYELFEVEPEALGHFLAHTDAKGLNVTIPYKKDVIPFLHRLSPEAEKLGAVNTIVRQSDGSLVGHNTDYYGFLSLLKRSNIPVSGKKVLVLGSGGASRTAVYALTEAGAHVTVISRTGENNYSNLYRHRDAAVIVNTTPVGMYPATGVSAVSLDDFPQLEGVIDLIYNPACTKLLLDARSRGIPCCNGLWMLVAQAKEAAEWFTGTPLPEDSVASIHQQLDREMRNIILIGMPGSGKTTLAQLLSQRLGRPFFDADSCIEEAAGKSIPEIFAQEGEAPFRQLESRVLSQLGKKSGIIIATGGGCVTVAENETHLRQNGTLYWIRRDLAALTSDGRPLSQRIGPETLYRQREHLYSHFSDTSVWNNGDINEAAETIAKDWRQ